MNSLWSKLCFWHKKYFNFPPSRQVGLEKINGGTRQPSTKKCFIKEIYAKSIDFQSVFELLIYNFQPYAKKRKIGARWKNQ